MVFSSKLTEEEQFLKKQFQTLKNLKKELKQLTLKRKQEQTAGAENGPPNAKQKKAMIQASITTTSISSEFSSGGPNYNTKKLISVDAAANTEAAKKLLKSGAIQVKVENKITFKRSSNLKRRMTDSGPRRQSMFQSFSTGSDSTEEDSQDDKPMDGKVQEHSKPIPKQHNAPKPGERRNLLQRREKKSRLERKEPKKGNTVYVHGYVVSEKIIKQHFSTFGNIVDLKVEEAKSSGFVTYDSFEAADKAIKEMDETLVDDCRLKVSLARNQKMLGSVVSSDVWSGLVDRGDKGSGDRDTRSLVKYDDDDINFD